MFFDSLFRSAASALIIASSASSCAFAQTVKLETTAGDIVLELDPAKAPKSVDNFLKYVQSHHYDGTIFHRVIIDFMIQGGGLTADRQEKEAGKPIRLESKNGLKNVRGSVAMARTEDPNSATAQFFINVKDNDFLNAGKASDRYGYAVFGKVTSGMEVVDKIRSAPTGPEDFPNEAVVITRATVER